ncbi:MAG TPA: DUF1080 domain-containing protein [Gemmataceae bacterium]|nr:DUF1080 domain-containing protein [Gemmataceae bacterium]
MRRFALFIVILLTTEIRADDKGDGFMPLFNGKDLNGWKERQVPAGKGGYWSVKDGILTAKAGTGWLGTEKMYGNYVLRVEWKIVENGNSGVFLRVPDTDSKESPSTTGFEIQILDDNGSQYKGKLKPYQYSGSLYYYVPASKPMFKGVGEWNSYEITCNGDKISVIYNGEKVVDADISKDPKMQTRPKKGFIGLQNHGSAVEFRKVEIKVLDD